MKIQNMFQKDIDRDINGVIKVSQDDQESLKQELSEYIITKDLRRCFDTFFDNYSRAIDVPTDKVGVWISGFFGSGKSHFLKMLSYLLSNKKVDGREALDYFKDKLDDAITYAMVERCVRIPTESILFNIDIEGPIKKDKTAVLRVFAKVFYNHCGFYGDDLKTAKLERFIDKQGKTEAFRAAFKEINGEEWVDTRSASGFFEDDIVEVMQSVLGMSETAARNWFNGEENADMSIKQLVSEIKEYVDSKGDNFRLLFCVDEVGQYIGDDGDLMINLQSLVEEIGDKCRGKVWVMVTSQEGIDSVVKITGDDFSKIQGRFNTRLSLSSSSVDEVIKKRILAKTDEADSLLKMEYEKEASGLKSLFVFDNPILDIKGFTSAEEFSATFPFIPYQFIIIQKVLAEIRKHGNSGKHLSGGERSMLSGFQEAAQRIENKDENALVPFYQFYDTVHTFLESTIRRVIDRCQNAADAHDGLEQQDVNVLKLLYLIRYIDDIKANIENISILMIDDIHADKITLRASIAASLDRLLTQNYISRNGDTYTFLTDEEQDVAVEIKNTSVDSAQIVQSISQTVYGEIYPAKKFKYGRYDFAYDQYVDETLNGASCGGMRLRIVTAAADFLEGGEARLLMESQINNEAIVVLSADTPYYDELEQAMRIRKYVKKRNVSQMPESFQRIIRDRNDEARRLESHARSLIEKAIVDGKFYVHGEILEQRSGSAKEKLDGAMTSLVESVYSKLNYVNRFADSDADILEILNGAYEEIGIAGTGANNEEALNEISQWLELKNQNGVGGTISMGDVQRRFQALPFGWREIDIAALVARLVVQQKIQIRYGGAVVEKDDRRLVDYLRKKSEIDKAIVVRKVAPPEELIRKSVAFLRDYKNAMDVPTDADALNSYVLAIFEAKREYCQKLLDNYYSKGTYPEKEKVETEYRLMVDILGQRKDNIALLTNMVRRQDELFESAVDMEDVEMFFKAQREVYDDAQRCLTDISREREYFAADTDTIKAIGDITAILSMPRPYSRIGELPELIRKINTAYAKQLTIKREEVLENIRHCMEDVHQLAGEARNAGDVLRTADGYFEEKRKAVAEATTLTQLDAMTTQVQKYSENTCRYLEKQHDDGDLPGSEPPARKITTIRRYDLCAAKRLQSKEDVDKYVESIREKLITMLESCDGVQIN